MKVPVLERIKRCVRSKSSDRLLLLLNKRKNTTFYDGDNSPLTSADSFKSLPPMYLIPEGNSSKPPTVSFDASVSIKRSKSSHQTNWAHSPPIRQTSIEDMLHVRTDRNDRQTKRPQSMALPITCPEDGCLKCKLARPEYRMRHYNCHPEMTRNFD